MATSQQQLNFAIRAVNEASATLKQIQNDIDGVGTKAAGASKQAGGLGASLGSVGKIAAGVGGGLLAAQGISVGLQTVTSQFFAATKAGSDYAETLSKSNTIFGTNAKEIEDWAARAAKSIGQSKTQALDAAATFGNMFTQLGIGRVEAAKMSQKMVELASDFASFHNANISDVLIAQTAAFRGEYDAVQRYVPTINAAAVEQKALEMGLAATSKELTAQHKALATQTLLIEGAGAATGDFARTQDGAANKTRIMNAELENMRTEIGTKLLPVQLAAVNMLVDDFIPAVQRLGDAFDNDALPYIKQTADGLGVIIGLLEGAVDRIDDFAAAVDRIPTPDFLPGAPSKSGSRAGFLRGLVPAPFEALDAIGEVRRIFGGDSGEPGVGPALEYATGGIVPGPIGAPQFAVVHGGEEVLTPVQRMRGAYGGPTIVNHITNLSVNVDGSLVMERKLEDVMVSALQRARRRGEQV